MNISSFFCNLPKISLSTSIDRVITITQLNGWVVLAHSCSNYAKNQTVYKKSIALLLRRYWFSSDDVKMKFVYFFMLSKIEVLTFPKKNIFYHFEVHLRSKGSENGYIANIEYLHLNCPNFPKLSCFMVFAHTRTQ